MKDILIVVHDNKRATELSSLTKTLFPECEIRVVSAGGEEHTSRDSGKKTQGPESRIEGSEEAFRE